LATSTYAFAPLNENAFPTFPGVTLVAPWFVPVLLFPDASATVVIVPVSSIRYHAFNAGSVPVVVNVAVTLWAALSVTAHVPVPVHAPLQPPKVLPASGVAVSVTLVPLG
jgi:hypothetical protein